jgi:hypothetical protein
MKKALFFTIGFGLLISMAACSFGPPPDCGDTIGGVADTAKFDQFFNTMNLVSLTTGNSGPEGDSGQQYSQGESLAINIDVKSEVAVRACIQPMGGGSSLTLDETITFSQGVGSFDLGSFSKGTYVIRVIVDNTLVKNFPFSVNNP